MEDKFAGFIARWLAHSATPNDQTLAAVDVNIVQRRYCSYGCRTCAVADARGRRIYAQMTFNWLVGVMSSVGFTLDRQVNVASRLRSAP